MGPKASSRISQKGLMIKKFVLITLAILMVSDANASGMSKRKPSPLTAKGDIYTRTSTVDTALAVGADGTILSADASTSTGLRWVTPGSSGTVTNSGTLTSNAVIIGQGTTVVAAITADTAATGHFLASTATSPAFRQVLTSDVVGTIPEAIGGTGKTSYTKGDILVASASTTLVKLGVGSNGQVLSADSGETSGVKWATLPTSGSGTPAGSSGQIQFNNAGSFGGAAFISTDTTGNFLRIGQETSTIVSLDVAGNIRSVPFRLTDGSSIALDCTKSNYFTVTLAGQPRTLANATNCSEGQSILVRVSQDATGSRKMGFGTNYKFGTDVPSFDASTTASTKDYIRMIFNGVSMDVVGVAKGYR